MGEENKNWFARHRTAVFGIAVAVLILNLVVLVAVPTQTPVELSQTVTEYALGKENSRGGLNKTHKNMCFILCDTPDNKYTTGSEPHCGWQRRVQESAHPHPRPDCPAARSEVCPSPFRQKRGWMPRRTDRAMRRPHA